MAGQSGARIVLGAGPVIDDLEPDLRGGRLDPDRAPGSAAVAHDVRGRLADHPAQERVGRAVELFRRALDTDVDPCRSQGHLRARQLRVEVHAPIACNRVPDVAQGRAHQRLDLAQFGRGLRRIPVQQPARKLGLEGDHGQAVTKEVVQVPRDPGTLAIGGQPGDLSLGPVALARGPFELAEPEHPESDQQDLEDQFQRPFERAGGRKPRVRARHRQHHCPGSDDDEHQRLARGHEPAADRGGCDEQDGPVRVVEQGDRDSEGDEHGRATECPEAGRPATFRQQRPEVDRNKGEQGGVQPQAIGLDAAIPKLPAEGHEQEDQEPDSHEVRDPPLGCTEPRSEARERRPVSGRGGAHGAGHQVTGGPGDHRGPSDRAPR